MKTLVGALRDADFLTAERATAWCRILALAPLLLLAAGATWLVLSGGSPADPSGKPVGTDFINMYGASVAALSGNAAGAYDPAIHHAIQTRVIGVDSPDYFAFHNPPPYLFAVLPLALLPYIPALLAWIALTGTAYAVVIARIMGDGATRLPLLAFPAVFVNIGHGHNGLLSAALFGAAALCLDRRAVSAGIAIGLLCYKPQLAVLAPVALAAAARWGAFFSAAATVIGLALLSLLAFGVETWNGFTALGALTMDALEQGLAGPGKIQSTFAAVRLFGGSVALAYALHGIVVLVAAVAIARAARRADGLALGAMIAAGGALASPYIYDYDLAILAVPLAYVFREARLSGTFLPWEKTVLGLCFLLPLVARMLSMNLYLPVTPPLVACLLAVVIRRSRATLR